MKNVHFAIPEIYGETLSYYELLRKLVDKTNELIDNYNTVPEQIAEEVKNLDASQLFSTVLNQLIHSIASDNTKSANAVKVYKKHDLLYATFDETVNLYESLIDFTTGTETELIVGTNIREVNISELFIELRKLIGTNKNNIEAVTAVANENSAEIATMHGDITAIENKNTEQDNELSTLRTMISSPYNFKGEVGSISALPASGAVNDTYYVQDVKYKVTWTGSAWVQSSLSEADYETELSELKGDIVAYQSDISYPIVDDSSLWEIGTIIDGEKVHDASRIRTKNKIRVNRPFRLSISNNNYYAYIIYFVGDTQVASSGWNNNYIDVNTGDIYILLAKNGAYSGESILPSDKVNVTLNASYHNTILNDLFDRIEDSISLDLEYIRGSMNSDGTFNDDSARYRTKPIEVKNGIISVSTNGDRVRLYTAENFTENQVINYKELTNDWTSENIEFSVNNLYVFVLLANSNDSTYDITNKKAIISLSNTSLAVKNKNSIDNLITDTITIKEDVSKLKETVDLSIPSYYETEVTDTISKLELSDSGDLRLVVVSDIHYDNFSDFTDEKLGYLMKSVSLVADGVNADAVLMLGDYIEGGSARTKEFEKTRYDAIIKYAKKIRKPVMMIMGNHDNNEYDLSNYNHQHLMSHYISKNEFANNWANKFIGGKTWYYYDIPIKDTRIIMTNTSDRNEVLENGIATTDYTDATQMTQEQLNDIEIFIDGCPYNNIVVGGHILNRDLLNLLKTKDKVKLFCCGHYHNDALEFNETLGFSVSSVSCASIAYNEWGYMVDNLLTSWEDKNTSGSNNDRTYKRISNTINETSFDVLSISNERIKKVKFGCGVDREIILG